MNYDNIHHNYIIISKLRMNDFLLSTKSWQNLIYVLDKLVLLVNNKSGIRVIQHSQHNNKYLKFGRLYWSNDSLNRVITDYSKLQININDISFIYFQATFPSTVISHKDNSTPKLTITINDAYNQTEFGSGILISFRSDYYKEIGSEIIIQAINEIAEITDAVLKIEHKRPYGYRWANIGYSNCIQDLHPTNSIKVENKLIEKRDDFKDWVEF